MSTEDLIKLPAEQLLTKFGSGGHKPGSGSAAALLGLVACKLLQTVVALTAGREKYQGVEGQLTLANQQVAEDVEPILRAAMQEDSDQFDRVIQARRARDATTNKAARRVLAERALAELRSSTIIALRIAEACIVVVSQALVVFDLGFRAARGDAGVAISAALAGVSGALAIVYLNLTSFKGSEWARETRARADALEEKARGMQFELAVRVDRLKTEAMERESAQLS